MFARLGFAVAIHVDSDIFLADEVLAVGDRPFKKKCMQKMEEVRDSGGTLFYVSHAAGSVRKMCDRVHRPGEGRGRLRRRRRRGHQVPPLRRQRGAGPEDEETTDEELGSDI